MRALSEQDAAKSHDNDLFDFGSSSAILNCGSHGAPYVQQIVSMFWIASPVVSI